MRTVKEVAKLSGVSVRTLQYYDEIGVLKPTKVNDAGYRLYDNTALEKLQQILFFKELDFSLKEIKEIMEMPDYDRLEIFKRQKELLTLKRDRLNRLLTLLDKLERGESTMSFNEFNMSEYYDALEQFKQTGTADIIKYWGSLENFDEFVGKVKANETTVAQIAIRQFGSIEKYTQAMKYNMEHFDEIMEKTAQLKQQQEDLLQESDDLYMQLTCDMTRDVFSQEIQDIVAQIVAQTQKNTLGMNMGDGFWDMVIESYADDAVKDFNDTRYGAGASEYIASALKYHFVKKQDAR